MKKLHKQILRNPLRFGINLSTMLNMGPETYRDNNNRDYHKTVIQNILLKGDDQKSRRMSGILRPEEP